MNSAVYFLQVMPDGPIKIGYTSGNPCLRMRALQAASPHELKWIGYFHGGRKEEAAAHRLFATHRYRNEWFNPHPDVLDFIAEKSPNFCPVRALNETFLEPERQAVLAYIAPEKWTRENTRFRAVLIASGFRAYEFAGWVHRERLPDRAKVIAAAEFVRSQVAA